MTKFERQAVEFRVETKGGGVVEPPPPASLPRSAFDLIFGVILPLIAITLESWWKPTAELGFDPMPTKWDFLAVAAVPAANFLLWWKPRRGVLAEPWLQAFANAFSMAVAAIYSVFYLPIAPFGILFLAALIGLLPLTPYFSLAVAIRQRLRMALEPGAMRLRVPLGLAVLLLIGLHLPGVATQAAMQWAADRQDQHSDWAIWLLRNFGDRDKMLAACSGRGASLWILGRPYIYPSRAQEIYYRATGEVFDGAVEKDISADVSAMDSVLDSKAGVARIDWTILFHNQGAGQKEARAVIELPEDGVVSAATLWVNGQPREAAFGGRAQTQQAYDKVVRARRDPLLVTTQGKGRVLVQCFPVPPGGEMKIRLGITAPAVRGEVVLPRIVQRNFTGETEPPRILKAGSPDAMAWTPDPLDPSRFHITQRWEHRFRPRPAKLIVVVDGSRTMRPFSGQIERQIAEAQKKVDVETIFAGDFEGGEDNSEALAEAQRRGGRTEHSVVLWICGPQPFAQEWRLLRDFTPIYAVQMTPGANHLIASPAVHVWPPSIESAFARLTSDDVEDVPIRARVAGASGTGHRASEQLALLWAHEEALRTGSAKLAADYRLVTPATGAVVLENDRQYEAAGLKAPAAGVVPTVPEPSTWALLLVGSFVLGYAVWRRKRTCES